MQDKIAVILFNLGGPDCQAAVQPFLINLFSDPAILRLPQPFRWVLARLIAARRTNEAQKIYAQMGGGSPILPQTLRQTEALQVQLDALGLGEMRCFTVMRYWRPRADEVIRQVKQFNPKRVVLLPLYPQYSTTTTRSSFMEWRAATHMAGLRAEVHEICCFPQEPGFINAHAAQIQAVASTYFGGADRQPARLLFSAHGLPQRIVDAGDPYPEHIGRTARAIAATLKLTAAEWEISYQSRVGPLKWIGPSTAERVRAAAMDKIPLVICPIAFVSEHAETLVELDIEYKKLALECGAPAYARAPALGIQENFISGLAWLVQNALAQPRLCGVRGAGGSCLEGN